MQLFPFIYIYIYICFLKAYLLRIIMAVIREHLVKCYLVIIKEFYMHIDVDIFEMLKRASEDVYIYFFIYILFLKIKK